MSKKILEYVGDVDPIEYGGGVIFKENRNAWLEHTLYSLDDFEALNIAYSDDESETTLQIISIPLYTDEAAFWHFFNWIDWNKIAESSGISREEIRADSLLNQYLALQFATNYYGWRDFDEYPRTITIKDLRKRWKLE